jgi:hypothetical protein
MDHSDTTCDTCKKVLHWDHEGQEYLDETDSAMCPFFDYEDIHTVLD